MVGVLGLIEARIEPGAEERDRVKRRMDEEQKFVFRVERAQYGAGFIMRRVHGFAL